MPARPEGAAHELFSVLRELDAEGAQLIWVEEPPADPELLFTHAYVDPPGNMRNG